MKYGVILHKHMMYGTRLFKFNKDYKVLAAGMNALEMVRIEAGFIQPNATDFMSAEQALRPNRMRNPYELGLGWLVNLDKDYFTGKLALQKLNNKHLKKNLSDWILKVINLQLVQFCMIKKKKKLEL